MSKPTNRYQALVAHLFEIGYREGAEEVTFAREDIETAASTLKIILPKNLGDVLYSFRHRVPLPHSIRDTAPDGKEWVIASRGRALYAFELRVAVRIEPDPLLVRTKVPDATPGLVARYAMGDEQALLALLRYNRLLDVFTGVACYSLQSHLRTTAPKIGQVETDELYVGVDRYGAHYVFPVQAKGGADTLGVVQVEQDVAMCRHKFPALVCRPVAAQFMADGVIALFELTLEDGDLRKVAEAHYQLVASSDLSEDEIAAYRLRAGRP